MNKDKLVYYIVVCMTFIVMFACLRLAYQSYMHTDHKEIMEEVAVEKIVNANKQ